MSINNTSKTSVASFANNAKHAASPVDYIKSGYGWAYDETGYTYDQVTDPISGAQVFYDSVGVLPSWSNSTKHTA